jgi:hypothetical protein
LFDKIQFNEFNWNKKQRYIWENAYKYLKNSANFIKNNKLLDAVEDAYFKGIEDNLNPDYRLLEININYSKLQLKVYLWINFREDGMYSKLTLEKDLEIFFEKEIDKTRKGIEFFLEMYKTLEFDGNNIIIKGRKDVDYLPLKIPISNLF